MSSQPTHPATSETVPGFHIPSSMRIPLKIKPYFYSLSKTSQWKKSEKMQRRYLHIRKNPCRGLHNMTLAETKMSPLLISIPIS